MKYRVIYERYLYRLEFEVNEHLRDGWQIVGGVAVVPVELDSCDACTSTASDYRFAQAMIKDEKQGPQE